MKTSNIKKLISLSFVILMLAAPMAHAAVFMDKAVEKAREAVENASPDDWMTLAKSADKLIQRKKNLKEANEWLERSLAIKETVYNLTVRGDYYQANNLPDKALEYYVKAMNLAKSEDPDADITDIQMKVAQITNIGG